MLKFLLTRTYQLQMSFGFAHKVDKVYTRIYEQQFQVGLYELLWVIILVESVESSRLDIGKQTDSLTNLEVIHFPSSDSNAVLPFPWSTRFQLLVFS